MKKLQVFNLILIFLLFIVFLITLINFGFEDLIRGANGTWFFLLGLILSIIYFIMAIKFFLSGKIEKTLITTACRINALGGLVALLVVSFVILSGLFGLNIIDPGIGSGLLILGAAVIFFLACIISFIFFIIGYFKSNSA